MIPDIFTLRTMLWNRNNYPCLYIFPLEFGGTGDPVNMTVQERYRFHNEY